MGVCFLVRILSSLNSSFGDWFASPYVWHWQQLLSFEFYWRLFSHVVGHANWEHMAGNLTLYLLVYVLFYFNFGFQLVTFIQNEIKRQYYCISMLILFYMLFRTPMLEEKYDSILLLKMSAVTAVVSALVNCFISRQVVLGASGLVMLI